MTTTDAASAQVAYIVDDEPIVAEGVSLLLRSVGLQTRIFPDAKAFLREYGPEMSGCLVLDVRMPKMGGLELQEELNRLRCTLPIIFMTGHGDVPMAVEAMRAGAIDFLQKPFNDDELIRRVQRAFEEDASQRALLRERDQIEVRWGELTDREREIARRVAHGEANKVMASDLGISERTVELHRAHAMQKMGARSIAQLVRMILALEQNP